MATQIKTRRGSAAEHESFTGAVGEITVVTDDSSLRVHDGITVGGNSSTLQAIARSLNVQDSQVIYSTDTTTLLDDVLYIYDASTQEAWGKPVSVGAGETIVSVSGSDLVTSGGSYTLDRISLTLNFENLQGAVGSELLTLGAVVNLKERTTGNGGGAMWDVVLSSSVTENTFDIVQCTGVPALSLVLRVNGGMIDVRKLGAVNSTTIDSSAAIQRALDLPHTVYIPKGNTFAFSLGLSVGPGTTITGGGELLKISEINRILVSGDNITIDGVIFTEDDAVQYNASMNPGMVEVLTANNFIFRNNIVQNAWTAHLYCRDLTDYDISHNIFRNGRYYYTTTDSTDLISYPTDGGGSLGDIVVSSTTNGKRGIISHNQCLSNKDLGIGINSLGYDGQTIISHNIIVTLNPDGTPVEGVGQVNCRRHAIIYSYNNAGTTDAIDTAMGVIVSNNILGNTRWTGIYTQANDDKVGKGSIISDNYIFDIGKEREVFGNLTGGIFCRGINSHLSITGNVIYNMFANFASGSIRIVGNDGVPLSTVLISNNTVDNSDDTGIKCAGDTSSSLISNNIIKNCAASYVEIDASDTNEDSSHVVTGNYLLAKDLVLTAEKRLVNLGPSNLMDVVTFTDNTIEVLGATTYNGFDLIGIYARKAADNPDRYIVKNNIFKGDITYGLTYEGYADGAEMMKFKTYADNTFDITGSVVKLRTNSGGHLAIGKQTIINGDYPSSNSLWVIEADYGTCHKYVGQGNKGNLGSITNLLSGDSIYSTNSTLTQAFSVWNGSAFRDVNFD